MSEGQFAEILVKGEQQTLLGYCPLNDLFIRGAQHRFPDPQHIVPLTAQCRHAITGNVFVGTEAHGHRRPSLCHGKHLFVAQSFLRVGHTGRDLLTSQSRIVPKNLRLVPALGQQSQYKLHRQPCTFHDRFPAEHDGIDDDVLLPVHARTLFASYPASTLRP